MIYNLDFNSKVRCKFKHNSMHFNTKTVFIVIIMITFCIQVNCIKRHHRSSRSKQIHHQHHLMLSNIKDNNINDHSINDHNINDHSISDNNINDNRDKSFSMYKDMNMHNIYTKIRQINIHNIYRKIEQINMKDNIEICKWFFLIIKICHNFNVIKLRHCFLLCIKDLIKILLLKTVLFSDKLLRNFNEWTHYVVWFGPKSHSRF